MKNYSETIIKFRWVVIVFISLITLFFALQLPKLSVDSNIINSLPDNDSDVILFKQVGEEFGSNEIGMVIVKADNVLKPNVLDDIQLITDTISSVDGVVSVTSITNLMNIEVTDNDFTINTIINDSNRPKNFKEAELLKGSITKNEMVRGTFISDDATASVIIFSFQPDTDIQKVANRVMKKIESSDISEKYYFAGAPFMRSYVSNVVRHDMSVLIPISFLLISIVLYLSFHTKRGVLLPLLTSALSIIWSMGIFAVAGIKLSMVSNNVPIIILAVGTAYAIHVLNKINHCIVANYKDALKTTLSLMVVPVILSALTTMVGFLSFIFGSYLTMIRDFGILSALGTFFSAVITITLIPALMSFYKDKRNLTIIQTKTNPLLTKFFLLPIGKRVITQPRTIIYIWIVIFILSISGILLLKRSVSVAGYFKKSHPVSVSEKILTEKFGGTKPVFIVFNGDAQDPEMLKQMLDFESYLKKSPLIGSTQSVAGIVAKLNKLFNGTDSIPDASTLGQFWFLLGEQASIKNLVTEDFSKALIIAKFNDTGSNSTTELKKYIAGYLDNHNNYNIQVSGMPFINKKLSDSLLKSQIGSLTIALVLIVVIVSLMLSSFKKGMIATLPIVVTIGVIYGVMGFSSIPLNIGTVLVASIAIGIGIDYSIHFFSYYNYSLKNGKSTEGAIRESINVSGKAILINLFSVSIGFITLIFSNLVPMIYFGIIIALSMFGAGMGALTLLPSVILLTSKEE